MQVTKFAATFARTHVSLAGVGLAVAAALILILLLAFPAEIFNKTFDENEAEIHAVLTRAGLRRHHVSALPGLALFVVVGTGLVAWLSMEEGPEGNPLAFIVGLLVAMPVVNAAYEFTAELYLRRRSSVTGRFKVLPAALTIALACAVMSRVLKLEPAYLYGVFAGWAALRENIVSKEHEGKAVLVAALALALAAAAAWAGWSVLDGAAHGPGRGWAAILISTSCFWIFALASESLVFGLLPLTFLNGAKLRDWRPSVWLVVQVAAAAFFVYVLLLRGSPTEVKSLSEVVRPLIFFCAFGLASLLFWGYFRWDGRPTAGQRPPGEAPERPELAVGGATAREAGD